MSCCTCSLLVHHICTRLERINDDGDDDDDDEQISAAIVHHIVSTRGEDIAV